MRKKPGRIVSHTAERLAARAARGENRTDWAKAAAAPLPDGRDPDDAMSGEWIVADLPTSPRKTHASLRIDSDVLDWFKSQGRGYQTKINAVLRSYFLHHARR
jgi:uncharacterized protein (DUF4415 family)